MNYDDAKLNAEVRITSDSCVCPGGTGWVAGLRDGFIQVKLDGKDITLGLQPSHVEPLNAAIERALNAADPFYAEGCRNIEYWKVTFPDGNVNVFSVFEYPIKSFPGLPDGSWGPGYRWWNSSGVEGEIKTLGFYNVDCARSFISGLMLDKGAIKIERIKPTQQ